MTRQPDANGGPAAIRPTQLLSIATAAKRLDCSRGHVYSLIYSGQLRVVEIKSAGSTRPKSRIREEDLDAFIDAMTRQTRQPLTAVPAQSGAATVHRKAAASYGTPEAASYAGVTVDAITAAMRAGELHGTRRAPRSPWSVEHGCLVAWIAGAPCPHRVEGGGAGEVRRIDGT